MQIDQLALVYTRKTDEELLKIAADSAQLTPEAITALSGELAKRRIKPEPRRDEDAARIEQPVVPTIAQPIRALPTNQFLADVLDLYRGNFWFFIKLTAPAVSISWAAIVLSRHLTHQMALRYVTGHTLIAHPIVVLKMGLVTWSAFFIDWTTFATLYAAICVATRRIEMRSPASAFGALSQVGGRSAPFLRLSALLFLLFVLLLAAGFLLLSLAFIEPGRARAHPLTFQIFLFSMFGISALLLSRLALAIPSILLDNCKIRRAIVDSYKLTRGKWLILSALLAKSLIGGYIAGLLPFWTAAWIWRGAAQPPSFHWILPTLSIISVSAVEPTMFIGFALLYIRMSAASSNQPSSLA